MPLFTREKMILLWFAIGIFVGYCVRENELTWNLIGQLYTKKVRDKYSKDFDWRKGK